jgi:hypothetical protein
LSDKILYLCQSKAEEVKILTKKMGRPTDNPKNSRLDIRLDDECIEILEKYSKQENKSKAESARIGIKKLKVDIK